MIIQAILENELAEEFILLCHFHNIIHYYILYFHIISGIKYIQDILGIYYLFGEHII